MQRTVGADTPFGMIYFSGAVEPISFRNIGFVKLTYRSLFRAQVYQAGES
jgi:hypothetical protein